MPKYLTKKQLGPYSVKNVKTFMGREGYGYNCNLYRNGKRVGSCMDDASGGGMYPIDWGRDDKRIGWGDEAKIKEWQKFKKEEQKLLDAHIATLPKVPSGVKGMGPLEMDKGWFVDELINQYEEEKAEKKMAKDCRTKTLYVLKSDDEGQYWIMKAPYSPKVKAHIEQKHGDNLKEIINERFA